MPKDYSISESNKSPLKRVFVFLLVTLFSGFLVFSLKTWDQVSTSLESQLGFLDQLLKQNTKDTFKQHKSVLRILGGRLLELNAINSSANSRELINDIHNINPGMAALGVIKPNGQIVLMSGIPEGKTLPNLMKMKESAVSFKKVLTSNEMQAGRSYFLQLLQKWVIPIRIRVLDKNSSVALVVAAGINIDAKEITWNSIQLPTGYKIQLMRSDGYWQYSRPMNDINKNNFYPNKVNQELYDHISFLKNNNIKSHLFIFNNQYYHASYIKKWDLFTVVSVDTSVKIDNFISNLFTPLFLFLSFLIGGTLIYLLAVKEYDKHESILVKKANYDDLTDLPNRTLARDRLQQEINHANRNNNKITIIFFDLDQFKRINDGFGHVIGDKLLQNCASRLNKLLRKVDTVARLSGDEFLFILPSQDSITNIESVVNKIHNTMAEVFLIDSNEIFVNCSMGIAVYPDDAENAENLLIAADTALYKAKEQGRRTHCFYSSKMNDDMQRRLKIEHELRHALKNNEFYLAYQPKFDISSMKCIGVEALLRWESKALGTISPVEFISIAEDSGQIIEIGEYVINLVCNDFTTIENKINDDFTIALNISPVQLRKKGFVQNLSNTINEHNITPSRFELEITESTLINNPEELRHLEDENFTLAIDDFGTGFSSLSYLSKFPISTLKIDRAFVNDIESDINDAQLVIAIINMGKSLELKVVAEGIETEGQLTFLKDAGCHYGQGFYYSKPISLSELTEKYLS